MFDVVPVGEHLVDGVCTGADIDDLTVTSEHVRVASHQLVVHAGGDVGDREPALLLGDRGVELDLVQQVAEFLDQVVVGRRVVGVERLERVDDLVGLLEEVRDQRFVRLFDVPRTLLAQRAGELVEAHVLGADRRGEFGDPDRREVVGVDRAIEFGPRGVDDAFVGRAERLQDRDGFVAGGAVDRELDVRQHPVGVRVGDEQRAAFAGRRGGEVVTVDEADARLDRIDAEPGVGDVEERHRGQDLELDVRRAVGASFPQVAHGAFEHERRAGHGVQDLAVVARPRRSSRSVIST